MAPRSAPLTLILWPGNSRYHVLPVNLPGMFFWRQFAISGRYFLGSFWPMTPSKKSHLVPICVSTPGFLSPDACYVIHRNPRNIVVARHNSSIS
jgi:hypothetical protein